MPVDSKPQTLQANPFSLDQSQREPTPLDKYREEQEAKDPNRKSRSPVDPRRLDPYNILYGCAGPDDADIMVVGESWGDNEAQKRQPFVGNTGFVLDDILAATGPTAEHPLRKPLVREDLFITNVVPAHPSGNHMWRFFYNNWEVRNGKAGECVKGLYPKPIVLAGLERLKAQIEHVKPKLIIGMGNYTLWALTQSNFGVGKDSETSSTLVPTNITSWRGSMLYTNDLVKGIPFLPTYHPASTFHQYSNRFVIQHDLSTRPQLALENKWNFPDWKFIVRPSFAQAKATLHMLLEFLQWGPLALSVDIETRAHHISCCGIAWNSLEAICIPFMTTENEDGTCAYWSLEEETELVLLLRRVLGHKNARIIGQNFLYDAQYFAYYWGLKVHIAHDTMLTHHVLFPGTPRGLDYLSSLYHEHHVYWKDDGKDWQIALGEETNWRYNCTDCVRTYRIAHVEKGIVAREGMKWPWQNQHNRANKLALPMMLRGVAVDLNRRAECNIELAGEIDKRYRWIDTLIPEDVYPRKRKKNGQLVNKPWYSSPKQQQTIFYEIMGMKPILHKKTKRPTLDSEAIAVLKRREPLLRPILEPIEELRSLNKFHEFIMMELDPDNRMRCYYDPSGTETFRYSSRENAFGKGGNLENISKGREEEETE